MSRIFSERWCETCGKTLETTSATARECPKCEQWWKDNQPMADIDALEAADRLMTVIYPKDLRESDRKIIRVRIADHFASYRAQVQQDNGLNAIQELFRQYQANGQFEVSADVVGCGRVAIRVGPASTPTTDAANAIAKRDDEIERLREGLRIIQIEAQRESGSWVHLKRAIAIQASALLNNGGGNG